MHPKNCAINPDFVLTDRSNQQLLDGAKHLAGRSRTVTAHLVAHLAEIYARKLHVAEGFNYLGEYCVEVLGLSEDEGNRRAHAAVLAHKYPIILDMLLEGSIHLTSLRIIGKCLTPQNHLQVLRAARGKKKTKLEHLAAVLNPKPDVPTVFRKLPERQPETPQLKETMFMNVVHSGATEEGAPAGTMVPEISTSHGAEELSGNGNQAEMGGLEVRLDGVLVEVVACSSKPPRLKPLSGERYSLQMTINKEAHDALRELQDLLRHQVPNGDLVTILQDTIIERRDRVKAQKFGHTKRPRKVREQESWIESDSTHGGGAAIAPGNEIAAGVSAGGEGAAVGVKAPKGEPIAPGRLGVNSRHIPAAVKREVSKRDKGRCAFVAPNGRRCSATGKLEFHHMHAYALGGPATVENISLRCRTHNAYEGVALFGEKRVIRREGKGSSARDHATGSNRPGAIATSPGEGIAP